MVQFLYLYNTYKIFINVTQFYINYINTYTNITINNYIDFINIYMNNIYMDGSTLQFKHFQAKRSIVTIFATLFFFKNRIILKNFDVIAYNSFY